MSFKKTSDGRVFFKGADNDDAPHLSGKGDDAMLDKLPVPDAADMASDQTQIQILLLLKALNGKLKTSQEDRVAIRKQLAKYKEALSSFEKKALREQIRYAALEKKISETEGRIPDGAASAPAQIEEKIQVALGRLDLTRKLVQALEKKGVDFEQSLSGIKEYVSTLRRDDAKLESRQKALEKKQKEQEEAQRLQAEKMVDNVAVYAAIKKKLGETEERQKTLDNKIEDVSSEYLKLDRKIEKALEERTRILSKIERIENAVLETRDALNAKAMVLLTQQGAVAGIDMPMLGKNPFGNADPAALQQRLQEEALMPWWRRPMRISTLNLAMMAVIAVLFGWIISQSLQMGMLRKDLEGPDTVSGARLSDVPGSVENIPDSSEVERDEDTAVPTDDFTQGLLQTEDSSHESVATYKEDPIDLGSDEAKLDAFENNQSALASALNALEPGKPDEALSQAAHDTKTQESPVAETSVSGVLAYTQDLRARIKPDPNLSEIAKKIEAQAYAGVPEAQHDMGALYVAGHGEVKSDLARAVLWFKEAAGNGVANAKYNLGVLYHQGMGVTKDIDRAMQLYNEAAQAGHPEAAYNLGIAYIEGVGMAYNPKRAAEYFEAAAKKEITEAAYNLGLIYENGLLGETRPDEALMWYKEAADKGSEEARQALEQLAKSLGVELSDVNRIVDGVKLSRQAQPGGWIAGEKQPEDTTPAEQHLIAQIQQELIQRKLYSGQVDGKNGPNTEKAIRAFQSTAGLPEDGVPTQDLLNRIKATHSANLYVPPQ